MNNILGHATIISANFRKFKREISGKGGKDIQLNIIVIDNFISSFYASWNISLIVLMLLHLMVASRYFGIKVRTKLPSRVKKDYIEAG